MIKLIASDMDGTLLNRAVELTPRTLRALSACMAAGAYVSLSSGRMTESMTPYASQIGLNAPMILFNGAMIYDHRSGETLFRREIARDLAREICAALEEIGLYLQAYPGEGLYCAARTAHTRRYERELRVSARETGQPLSRWLESGVIKLLAIGDAAQVDKAQEALTRRFPVGAAFFKSRSTFLEIVAEGVNKGEALLTLCEALGVAPEESAAFGDGQNDAPMLARAGLAVAMRDGDPECLAQADLLAMTNAEDGVARVLESLMERGQIGRG